MAFAGLVLGVSSFANAGIIWDWEFNGEEGTFITDGSDLSAGNYLLSDFTVTSSLVGATIGSWGNGDYSPSAFGNDVPYWIVWNGSTITDLISSGSNWDTWFTFDDLSTSTIYLFDFGSGNTQTNGQAMAFAGNASAPSYAYTATPTLESVSVPEPSTLAIFALGLMGLASRRFKKQA